MLDFVKYYTDIEHSCDQKLLLAGISGSLAGSSYFVDKFDYNLNYIEDSGTYFGTTQNFTYNKIGLRSGKDKSYIIFGIKEYATSSNQNSFIAKTFPDQDCNTGTNPLLCQSNIGQFSLCEDFEKLSVGNLVPQGRRPASAHALGA